MTDWLHIWGSVLWLLDVVQELPKNLCPGSVWSVWRSWWWQKFNMTEVEGGQREDWTHLWRKREAANHSPPDKPWGAFVCVCVCYKSWPRQAIQDHLSNQMIICDGTDIDVSWGSSCSCENVHWEYRGVCVCVCFSSHFINLSHFLYFVPSWKG